MPDDIRSQLGLLHVYTGDGKGKTTCAFGLAMRAAGRELKVLIIQFMKPEGGYGEQNSAEKLGIEVRSRGRKGWVNFAKPDPMDLKMAEDALTEAAKEMASGDWDVIVLDELAATAAAGLLTKDAVIEALVAKNETTEVVITGRRCPEWLFELADYVTEMGEIKHPFKKGQDARKGIES